MTRAAKNTWYLFLLAVAAELTARLYGIATLEMLAKPLLMPLLAVWFYYLSPAGSRPAFWVIVALLLSWAGDVALLFAGTHEHFFLIGLGFFLLAHLTYIYVFATTSRGFRPGMITWATGFLLIMYGFLLVLLLWPGLGSRQIPVALYAMVITCMGLTALFRKAAGGNYVLVGAIFFIASDSVLAWDKFYEPLYGAGFWVMLTYTLGQFLIAFGMARCCHSRNSEAPETEKLPL